MAVDFASEQVYMRQSTVPSTGDGGSEGLTYIIHSTQTSVESQLAEVYSWLNSNAPATLGGQDPADSRVEEIADGYWKATLTYSTQQAQRNSQREEDVKVEGDNSWSFQISSTTQNVQVGKRLVSVTPAGDVAGEFANKKYPLGVDSDGNVNGIDVLVPEASWEETYYTAAANVTEAYRLVCMDLVGKVNNATFKGAAAHQVLLSGVSGQLTSQSIGGLWQLTFNFLYMQNISETFTLVSPADPPTFGPQSVSKTGWQIFDMRYRRVKFDGVSMSLPYQVCVHEVYEEGDFSTLNLP